MRQEIPNCQVKDAADQFMSAWTLLNKEPPGTGILLPLINAATVSIELYLKCLSSEVVFTPEGTVDNMFVVTAKPQQFGHKLVSIFEKIPKKYQTKINQNYASIFSNDSRSFKHVLKSLKGAFMQSRYPFEKEHDISNFSIKDLGNVCQFLSDFVSNTEVKETIYFDE